LLIQQIPRNSNDEEVTSIKHRPTAKDTEVTRIKQLQMAYFECAYAKSME
jgi:hypothetical protein